VPAVFASDAVSDSVCASVKLFRAPGTGRFLLDVYRKRDSPLFLGSVTTAALARVRQLQPSARLYLTGHFR
jgi:hypothetical protein